MIELVKPAQKTRAFLARLIATGCDAMLFDMAPDIVGDEAFDTKRPLNKDIAFRIGKPRTQVAQIGKALIRSTNGWDAANHGLITGSGAHIKKQAAGEVGKGNEQDVRDIHGLVDLIQRQRQAVLTLHGAVVARAQMGDHEGMTHATAVRRGRPFFGWYVVGGAFATFFLTFGFMYSFSVIAKPIAEAIHYDVEGVSTLFSLSFTVYLLAGVPAGMLVDRIGARAVVAAGGFLMGIGLIAASVSTTNLQISAAFGLAVGLGLACLYVPATDVVQAWFVRGRGYATGITVLGFSIGNLVIGPALAEATLRYGVRATLAGFGVLVMIVVPALSLLMIARPEDRGLYPDGDAEPPPDLAELEGGMSLRQACRTRPFWHLYAAIFIASFAIYLPFVHLGVSALRSGATALIASYIVAVLGLGGIVGRLAFGRASDKIKPRHALVFAFLGMAASMIIWYRSHNPWALAVFALVYGFFYTWSSSIEPAVMVDYFGEKHGGSIMGLLFTSAAAGSLFGPTLGGELVDRTGNYDLALISGAVLFVLAAVSMLSAPDPPDSPPPIPFQPLRLPVPRR